MKAAHAFFHVVWLTPSSSSTTQKDAACAGTRASVQFLKQRRRDFRDSLFFILIDCSFLSRSVDTNFTAEKVKTKKRASRKERKY
jgi:hypothetical protein